MATLSDDRSMSFADELVRELNTYRRGLEQLLNDVGGPPTPKTLQRKLGIPYTLCWQVFQVVEGAGGVAAAKHAPTPARLRTLLAPAVKAGFTRERADLLMLQAEQFREFMKSHAGDRAAFETLVNGVAEPSGGEGTRISMQHRRDLYRSLSHVWGKQVDSVYLAWMMSHDSASTKKVCTLSVRSGLRRLRPDGQLVLFGNLGKDLTWQPLDDESFRRWGMPVVEQFCPNAIPPVERVTNRTGGQLYRLAGSALGLKGSATLVSGQWTEKLKLDEVEETHFVAVQPTGLVIMDWIVDRRSYGDLSGRLGLEVVETSKGAIAESLEGAQHLPMEEKVTALGPADTAPGVPEVARWRELTGYAAGRLGWMLSDFDVYRVRMPFPIWGTTVRMVLR